LTVLSKCHFGIGSNVPSVAFQTGLITGANRAEIILKNKEEKKEIKIKHLKMSNDYLIIIMIHYFFFM